MSALLALYMGSGMAAHLPAVSSLVATEVIRAGDRITTANTAPGEDGMTEEDQALMGMQVRRTIYAGRPVLASNTQEPTVVERNQLVTVKYVTGGLEITLTGRAMDSAGIGDPVSVMNPSSRKLINGYVTEEGWVRAQ